MGESTVIPGDAANGMIDTALGRFPAPAGGVHVAIRPEHISLGGPIPAVVMDVVYQGSFKRVTARAGDVVMNCITTSTLPALMFGIRWAGS